MNNGDDFEQVLDRRLGDFEKVVEARLAPIHEGVRSMQHTMAVFVDKMSNLHKDYIPRSELEKELGRVQRELDDVKKDVKKLTAWRNTFAGAIVLLAFILTVLSSTQFWKG